jgi:hypothetical protein
VGIRAVKDIQDAVNDEMILRELTGSLNIFSNPNGNHLKSKKTR